MRPRFSLRTLLILTASVAAVCWWTVRPTILADKLVADLKGKNSDRFLMSFSNVEERSIAERLFDFHHGSRLENQNPARHDGYTIWRVPLTWTDLAFARRRVELIENLANHPSAVTGIVPRYQYHLLVTSPLGVHLSTTTSPLP